MFLPKNDDHFSPKGKYGNVQQALTETAGCTLCVAGRHSDLLALSVTEGGAAYCKACKNGRYSTAIGASKEVTCSKSFKLFRFFIENTADNFFLFFFVFFLFFFYILFYFMFFVLFLYLEDR